jgi:hypothetical protein
MASGNHLEKAERKIRFHFSTAELWSPCASKSSLLISATNRRAIPFRRSSGVTARRYMFPRQPSHPPITEPTIWSSIVATSRSAAGSCSKRVNPSIESLTLGGVTAASCHSRSTAASSSSRTGRLGQLCQSSRRTEPRLCNLVCAVRATVPP